MISDITLPWIWDSIYSEEIKIDALEVKMGKVVAETIQEICADYELRKLDRQGNLPKQGMWYGNEYYKALKQFNTEEAKNQLKNFIAKDHFYHGMPPEKYFNAMPSLTSPSRIQPFTFTLKKDCAPSDALHSFKTELCLLDCTQVCQIGQYHALLDVLGKEKFDTLLRAGGPTPMMIGNYSHPADPLIIMTKPVSDEFGEFGNRPVKVGQIGAFKNIDEYKEKHELMGEDQGINVVVLNATPNQQTFVGFGLPGSGATEKQTEQILIDKFNEKPLDISMLSDSTALKLYPRGKDAYKMICESYSSDEPICRNSIDDISFGYLPEALITFDFKLIQEIIDKPLKL